MTRRRRTLIIGLAAVAGVVAVLGLAAWFQPRSTASEGLLWERATAVFAPLPAAASTEDNPVTLAKVALGRQLFFDPRLSKQGNVSCNSCHNLATYGVDHRSFSPGDDGQLGGRNSPTVLNAALHFAQFWDGRAADVEEQAGMPVLNQVEMAIPDEAFLVERLAATPGYPQAFAAAFPGAERPLTYANLRRALGAFERTLLTPSRFDAYLEGDHSALDARERAGLDRFMSLGCTACHNGATMGAQFFRKFGLNGPYWVHTGSAEPDRGRYVQTGDPADRYVFKVASLRNVAETFPYFHDGSVATLPEAVKVMAELQVGVGLDQRQTDEIVAFLRSLTGELPVVALEGAQMPASGG